MHALAFFSASAENWMKYPSAPPIYNRVAKQKEAFLMGISFISAASSSLTNVLTLLGKSTASSEEASLLGSKISELQTQMEAAQEAQEQGTDESSGDAGDDGSSSASTLEEMQAQVTAYQIRLAQLAGENVKSSMQEQLNALNNGSTALSRLNSSMMDILG